MSNDQMKNDETTVSGSAPYRHVNFKGDVVPFRFETIPGYSTLNWDNLPGTIESNVLDEMCFISCSATIEQAIAAFRSLYGQMLSTCTYPLTMVLENNDDETIAKILFLALFPYFDHDKHGRFGIEMRALNFNRLFMEVPDSLNRFFHFKKERRFAYNPAYPLNRVSIVPLLLVALHALEALTPSDSFFHYETFFHYEQIPTPEYYLIENLVTEIKKKGFSDVKSNRAEPLQPSFMPRDEERDRFISGMQIQTSLSPQKLQPLITEFVRQGAVPEPDTLHKYERDASHPSLATLRALVATPEQKRIYQNVFISDPHQKDNLGRPTSAFDPEWPRNYKAPDFSPESSSGNQDIEKQVQEMNARLEKIEGYLAGLPLKQEPVFNESPVTRASSETADQSVTSPVEKMEEAEKPTPDTDSASATKQ